MIFYNEYMSGGKNVDRLGFSLNNPQFIPQEYLDNKKFIVFRTCHSYGDWVIISAMPKLLKEKYPDCTVVVPSPKCLENYFSSSNWENKHDSPFNNVVEVFANNPYVDGMIDEIPKDFPIYHDHFRIYNPLNDEIPLIKQMLKFWRFKEEEMLDSSPDIYWSQEEINQGDKIIKKYMGKENYGFLYIDDTFYINNPNPIREPLELKRKLIQKEINKHNLKWFYFSGNNEFIYNSLNEKINIKDISMSLRVQNYIKSKSKILIGHQGGYGTDCMPRYTKCYVVPNAANHIKEHFSEKINYLKSYD